MVLNPSKDRTTYRSLRSAFYCFHFSVSTNVIYSTLLRTRFTRVRTCSDSTRNKEEQIERMFINQHAYLFSLMEKTMMNALHT